MKKRSNLFIFVLLSLLLLFSCSLVRKKAESEKVKKTGNIAGIVFDVVTMEPLAGAWVYVEGRREMGTKSDTLGRFWLSSVPVGEYEVWAERIYYYRGEIKEVKVFNHSTSIVLHYLVYMTIPESPHWYPWQENKIKCDSTEFYNTYYKTLLRKKKTGNIAGIVVCEGNPVTDVQVSISGKKVTTDSTGKFFISDISLGAYIVDVSGDKCIKSYFKPVLVWPDSTTILILSSDTIPRPVLNCKVKVTTQIDSASFVKMDYKHIMELALSPPKKEVVSDSVKKIIINGDTVIEIPGPPYPGQVIEYTEEVIGDITGKQPKIGNIAGVVYSGEPLPEAEVRVRRLSGEWEEAIEYKGIGGKIERIWRKTGQKITYTDSLGKYFFSGIEPGEYEMYARGKGGLYKTETYEWHYDYKMTRAKGIKVAPDSTSIVNFGIVPGLLLVEPPLIEYEDVIIVCDSSYFLGRKFEEILHAQPVTKDPRYKTGNIAGVAIGENVKGIYVYILYTGLTGVKSTTTDSLGRYFIEGLKPGIYEIQAPGTMGGRGIKVIADYTSIVNFSVQPGGIYEIDLPLPIIWGGLIIKCERNCFFKKNSEQIIKLEKKYLNKKYQEGEK